MPRKGALKAKVTRKKGEIAKTEITAQMQKFGAFKHGKYATDIPALCKYCQFGGNEEVGGTSQCPKYDPEPDAVCRVREDIADAVKMFNTSNAEDLRAMVDIKLKELTVSTTFMNLANMWLNDQGNSKEISAMNLWIKMAHLAKDLQPKMSVSKKLDLGEQSELSTLVNTLFTPAAESKSDDIGKGDAVVEISNG